MTVSSEDIHIYTDIARSTVFFLSNLKQYIIPGNEDIGSQTNS